MSGRRASGTSTGEVMSWGVLAFAGAMLATAGLFQVLAGISALAKDDVWVVGQEYVYAFDLTTWGWIHLVIGVAAVAVGVCLLLGQAWAVVTGAALAVIGVVASFAWMPYYPWWSVVILVFNVLVMWATLTRLNLAERP